MPINALGPSKGFIKNFPSPIPDTENMNPQLYQDSLYDPPDQHPPLDTQNHQAVPVHLIHLGVTLEQVQINMMDVNEVVELLDKHEEGYKTPTQSPRMNNGDLKLTPGFKFPTEAS